MAGQEGKHYKWRNLEFYAERGMVTLIDVELAGDSKADAFKAMQRLSPGQFIKRAIEARICGDGFYPSETAGLNKMLEDATACAKEAKAQGDPTDPRVVSHLMRHHKKSSILTPGEVNGLLGPLGGIKWKLDTQKSDPRGIMLKGGPQVVPDMSISPKDWVTPKKAAELRKPKKLII